MNSSIIRRDRNPITSPAIHLYAIAYIAHPYAGGPGCYGATYMLAQSPEDAADAGLSRALYDLPEDEFYGHEATAVRVDTDTINQVAPSLQQAPRYRYVEYQDPKDTIIIPADENPDAQPRPRGRHR